MPSAHDLLLSLTAADALGAATEFKTPAQIAADFPDLTTYQPGSPFGFEPGEGTDDSQMTVATLLGFARGEGVAGVRAAYLDWLSSGPPDVGNLVRNGLRLGSGYEAWALSGYHAAGNGGLMRVAACNVAGFTGEELERQAALVTAITHVDPRCVLSSVFLVAFVEELGSGGAYRAAADRAADRAVARDVAHDLVSAGLLPETAVGAYRERLPMARHGLNAAVETGLDATVESQSGFVLHTLGAAVAHGGASDWQTGVERAARLGDDSDTVACVAGAILGGRGLLPPPALLAPLRLGHTWPGWQREWRCAEHFGRVVTDAQAARTH